MDVDLGLEVWEEFGEGEIVTRAHYVKSISLQLKKKREKNYSLSTNLTLEKLSSVRN